MEVATHPWGFFYLNYRRLIIYDDCWLCWAMSAMIPLISKSSQFWESEQLFIQRVILLAYHHRKKSWLFEWAFLSFPLPRLSSQMHWKLHQSIFSSCIVLSLERYEVRVEAISCQLEEFCADSSLWFPSSLQIAIEGFDFYWNNFLVWLCLYLSEFVNLLCFYLLFWTLMAWE